MSMSQQQIEQVMRDTGMDYVQAYRSLKAQQELRRLSASQLREAAERNRRAFSASLKVA